MTNTHPEAMERAIADWPQADGREVWQRNPYLATSEASDAYLITSWSLYHSGQAPRTLHKSRGHSWIADLPGLGIVRLVVTNSKDHRDGVACAA